MNGVDRCMVRFGALAVASLAAGGTSLAIEAQDDPSKGAVDAMTLAGTVAMVGGGYGAWELVGAGHGRWALGAAVIAGVGAGLALSGDYFLSRQ